MIFEEALVKLREGKKIYHPSFAEDEYLIACYTTLKTIIDDDGKELIDSLDDAKERGMSITLMKGENIHPNMHCGLPILKYLDLLKEYPQLHERLAYPVINLLLIMSDEWEIRE